MNFSSFALRRPVLLLVLFLCGVALTTRWLVADPDMSVYRFDSISYLEIARHAPGLPGWIDVSRGHPEMPEASHTRVPYQHAQRLIGPYVVGLIARASGVSEEHVFCVATLLLLLATSLLLHRALLISGLDATLALLFALVFVADPFGFRFFLAVPTYFADVLFQFGVAVFVWALFRRLPWGMAAGLVLAGLGRQTVMGLFPGAALCIFSLGLAWRRSLPPFLLAVAISVFVYHETGKLAFEMWPRSINLEHIFGLWHWITRSGMPGHSREGLDTWQSSRVLGEFFLRGMLPFLVPIALMVSWLRSQCPLDLWKNRSALGLLLMFAGTFAQPILGGPVLTQNTVSRLTALALIPLLAAMAIMAHATGLSARSERAWLPLSMLLLFLSSLHYRSSWLAGWDHGAWLFAAFQILAVGWFLFRGPVASSPSR